VIHRKFIGTVHADNYIFQYRTSEVTLCHAAFSTRFARLFAAIRTNSPLAQTMCSMTAAYANLLTKASQLAQSHF